MLLLLGGRLDGARERQEAAPGGEGDGEGAGDGQRAGHGDVGPSEDEEARDELGRVERRDDGRVGGGGDELLGRVGEEEEDCRDRDEDGGGEELANVGGPPVADHAHDREDHDGRRDQDRHQRRGQRHLPFNNTGTGVGMDGNGVRWAATGAGAG